ncbi:tryptophan synthase subunit alpha [Candidatus Micrarchaeota archaeon]|nr:tryptophan synthase subunit alpha [Candidatus Micrarchaeota archaeon]MBU1681187.1 tryptophan synthase subunit alpha [Candidatus Micrarchaeota archaeon]
MRELKKPALMPYVCCGDPNVQFTKKLIKAMVANGADAIELGIPFSDPMADGKTIQEAITRALKGGMTPGKALEMLKELRKEGVEVPIFIMTYYNIPFSSGIANFTKLAKEAGADGFIIPDLPIEESDELRSACDEHDLVLVQFITPGCSSERLEKIVKNAKGFLYAVSVLGITGARDGISEDAIELIKRTKKITELPVVIGFGISNEAQASQYVKAGADGVIIGSKIAKIYSNENSVEEVARFCSAVKEKLQKSK